MLAIMLAATGIYGLAAYSVAQRVREIGIRIAIGARPANVVRLVYGRTAVLVAAGSLAGLASGSLGSQVLASVVVGISPRDPLVVGGAALTMTLLGIAAACGPLRRALTVDPVQAPPSGVVTDYLAVSSMYLLRRSRNQIRFHHGDAEATELLGPHASCVHERSTGRLRPPVASCQQLTSLPIMNSEMYPGFPRGAHF